MANVQSGYHSFFFSVCLRTLQSKEPKHSPRTNNTLGIFCVIYFPQAHPTQTATILIYICWHVILSLRMRCANRGVANKGTFSCSVYSWITPNAHMARDPNKDNLLPILVKSMYSSRICTKTGCSYFKLNIAFRDESESDSIKNDFLLEQ